MNDFPVSEIVQSKRLEKHISQSKLCKGICSMSMLSKIENGERYPTKFLFDTLMERLGSSGDITDIIITEKESSLVEQRVLIKKYQISQDFENLNLVINKYESNIKATDSLNKQFLYYSKSLIAKDYFEKIELSKVAISCIYPEFDYGNIKLYLLSITDILLLNSLAGYYSFTNNVDTSICIYTQLISYIEDNIEEAHRTRPLQLILTNLSNLFMVNKEYMQAIVYADKGISLCQKYNKPQLLSNLYYNKSVSLSKLGLKKEATKCAVYMYYLSVNINRLDYAEIHRTDLEETCNIKFNVT